MTDKKSKSIDIKFWDRFRARGGWWVVGQFVIIGLFVVALSQNGDAGAVQRWLGLLLVVVGIGLGIGGFSALRDKVTAMPAPVDGAVLRDRGAYAIVRRPIYGVLVVSFFGLALRGANLLAAALALVLLMYLFAKASYEERLLADAFPEYADYKSRVRQRILPWIL